MKKTNTTAPATSSQESINESPPHAPGCNNGSKVVTGQLEPTVTTKAGTLAAISLKQDSPLWNEPLSISGLQALRVQGNDSSESVPIPSAPKIQRPGKQTWIRTLGPESEWECFHFFSPEGEPDQVYVVSPEIAAALGSVVSVKRLVPCQTPEGVIFFWPLAVSDRPNSFSDSARLIAGQAIHQWRRLEADLKAKVYQAYAPRLPKPDPVWPSNDQLQELLLKALEGRVINSLDHPAIAALL